MSLLRSIANGLRSLFRRKPVGHEPDEELNGFLEMAAEQKMKHGMSRQDALRAVRLEQGSLEFTKEVVRSAGWESFVETVLWDTRHALRRLRLAPVFTIAIVLTLALGIGATTSIFTLIHAVLLKSVPVTRPGELYRLGKESRCCYQGGYSQDKEFSLVSHDLYKYFRENTKGFSELAAFPASEPLFGVRHSGSSKLSRRVRFRELFHHVRHKSVCGTRAYACRRSSRASAVVVMSYRLWVEKYGSDPSVVGSVFNLNDKPFIVAILCVALRPTPFCR